MKLQDVKQWKAVIFKDRTILKQDVQYMSADQIQQLMETDIEPTDRKGYYKSK